MSRTETRPFIAARSATVQTAAGKKARRTNIDVGYRELVAPPRDEFNLEPGDIVAGPDKQLDGEQNKWHRFQVTKVYKHFFEAIRLDKGWTRSFTKADYITGVIRRVKNEQDHD